jgi:hypothetical protein
MVDRSGPGYASAGDGLLRPTIRILPIEHSPLLGSSHLSI